MNENQMEKIKKIADYYGFEHQCEIFVEECAEAIQAVQKFKRAKQPQACQETMINLFEEVADVLIMAEQMRLFLTDIDGDINHKLNRQISRIKYEEKYEKKKEKKNA